MTPGGLSGILDLSDPLRDVYLELLRAGELSRDELEARDALRDTEALDVYLRILVRQGVVERRRAGSTFRYRAVVKGKRRAGVVDSAIWEALED